MKAPRMCNKNEISRSEGPDAKHKSLRTKSADSLIATVEDS
jgi:hypothetical protein